MSNVGDLKGNTKSDLGDVLKTVMAGLLWHHKVRGIIFELIEQLSKLPAQS